MADGDLGTHFSPDVAAKLAKMLGMLSIAHDGEIAVARRRADPVVKGAGLKWNAVIVPPISTSRQQYRPPRRWRRPTSPSDAAALCQWPEVLDDWETRFCRSIASQRRISVKQAGVLAKIIGKVEAFARAAGECA